MVWLFWFVFAGVASAQDSSHYAVHVERIDGYAFDDTGGLALLSGRSLYFLPADGRFHTLTAPKLTTPSLVALGEGAWILDGDHYLYASLDAVRKASGWVSSQLDWNTVPRPESLPSGAPVANSAVHCTERGGQVELKYDDAGPQTLTLPAIRNDLIDHERELCEARVVHVRGRVWFATDQHIFSREQGSWLVISKLPPPSVTARLRKWVRYWSLDTGPFVLLLAVSALLAALAWLGSERPRSRLVLRALIASLFAPPLAFASASTLELLGHAGQTSAHGASGALLLALATPFVLLSIPLPAVGAWLGERLGSKRPGGSFGRACMGGLLGAVFALPVTLPLLRSSRPDVLGFVAASALIGVCSARAYVTSPAS